MAVATDQIRQIITENNITSVADVYALLQDSFKNILLLVSYTSIFMIYLPVS